MVSQMYFNALEVVILIKNDLPDQEAAEHSFFVRVSEYVIHQKQTLYKSESAGLDID